MNLTPIASIQWPSTGSHASIQTKILKGYRFLFSKMMYIVPESKCAFIENIFQHQEYY